MQRILVEQARRRWQLKRGGAHQQVELVDVEIVAVPRPSDDELLALDDALRQLQLEDPAKAGLVRF